MPSLAMQLSHTTSHAYLRPPRSLPTAAPHCLSSIIFRQSQCVLCTALPATSTSTNTTVDSQTTPSFTESPIQLQGHGHAGHLAHDSVWQEELQLLLNLLPRRLAQIAAQHPEIFTLVEVVMDLGRKPLIRFSPENGARVHDEELSQQVITQEDLQEAIKQVGDFDADNRAGIDKSLHRISCLRNRQGRIVGLTCRAGRCIPGSAALIDEYVKEGKSILLLGRPGVGKTTAVREISRLLAGECKKRVVIVDTSNEIGGDGDVPHPGVGEARRMQVPHPNDQHRVMIEAVENHTPQAIIIDEIGTEAECLAARTIAQRGVQLVATAHGEVLENVVKNPSLQDLVGGVVCITLGDETAKKRGIQKTVLEREGPPTFDVAVEMESRGRWRIHEDVAAAVDAVLSGQQPTGVLHEWDTQSDEIRRTRPPGASPPRTSNIPFRTSVPALAAPPIRRRSGGGYLSGGTPGVQGVSDVAQDLSDQTWNAPGTGNATMYDSSPTSWRDYGKQPQLDSEWAQWPTAETPGRRFVRGADSYGSRSDDSMTDSLTGMLLNSESEMRDQDGDQSDAYLSSSDEVGEGEEEEGEAAWPWPSRDASSSRAWDASTSTVSTTVYSSIGANNGWYTGEEVKKKMPERMPEARKQQQPASRAVNVLILMDVTNTHRLSSALKALSEPPTPNQPPTVETEMAMPAPPSLPDVRVRIVRDVASADIVVATPARLKARVKIRQEIQRRGTRVYQMKTSSSLPAVPYELVRLLRHLSRPLGKSTAATGNASSHSGSHSSDGVTSSGDGSSSRGEGEVLDGHVEEWEEQHMSTEFGFKVEDSPAARARLHRLRSPRTPSPGGSDYEEHILSKSRTMHGDGRSPSHGVSVEGAWGEGTQLEEDLGRANDDHEHSSADDVAELLADLVRELQYLPVDRIMATQMLGSFLAAAQVEGCSVGSLARLCWALSYTKHKRRFVSTCGQQLGELAALVAARCHEFSGPELMLVLKGYEGLKVLPSHAWLDSMRQAATVLKEAGGLRNRDAEVEMLVDTVEVCPLLERAGVTKS